MKPSSTRERILLILAPSILVIAVYSWFLYPRRTLEQATRGLEAVRKDEPSFTDFKEREFQVQQLNADLKTAQAALATLQTRREEVLRQRSTGSETQLSAVRELTELLVSHRMHLLDEGPLDEKISATFPEPLQAAERQLLGKNADASPRTLWKLRFYGRYADVLAVTRWLAEQDHQAIPVQLVMEEAHPDSAWRTWTLVVWI